MARRIKKENVNIIPGGKLNNFLNNFSEKAISLKSSKKLYLILLIAGVLLLAIYKKEWFIAATVNGSPITNLELQMKLNQQFRNQLLNQLVNEKVILDEARQMNAAPSDLEIATKISELEANVGGAEVLDTLLLQQAQTRVTLKDQIRLQLAIAKLYDKEASVSAEEVAKFLEENRENLQATESAKQEIEAFDLLKQQKLSQIFSQKFQELREKANIKIF